MNIEKYLPLKVKFLLFISKLDKTKIYSKKFFMQKLGISDAVIRKYFNHLQLEDWDKICIDNKRYYGHKNVIKKIRKMCK